MKTKVISITIAVLMLLAMAVVSITVVNADEAAVNTAVAAQPAETSSL